MKASIRANEFRDGSTWDAFRHSNQSWIEERANADGVLYGLPLDALPQILALFKLRREEEAAERTLCQLSEAHHALGWINRRLLKYSLLDKPLPLPTIDDPNQLLRLGWTEEQVNWLRKGGVPREDVFHRRRAAAG